VKQVSGENSAEVKILSGENSLSGENTWRGENSL